VAANHRALEDVAVESHGYTGGENPMYNHGSDIHTLPVGYDILQRAFPAGGFMEYLVSMCVGGFGCLSMSMENRVEKARARCCTRSNDRSASLQFHPAFE
tara:strand:- start:23 stop:322 length:300 start_codon:yes stop_codon:yes gene_type:complete